MSVHARIAPARARAAPSRARTAGDTAFALLAFATSLFIIILPKIGPSIFLALILLQAAYRPDRMIAMLYRSAPILLIPAYCLLSAAWSAVPATTLYYATLYLMTVLIGLILGSVIGARSFLAGMFGAFAAYAGACFAAGVGSGFFWSGAFGKVPLIVLAGSKNVNGDVAALGTMVGMTMLFAALRRRQPGWLLASIALILIDLALLRAALSTGAIVSMLVGVAVIGLLSLASLLPATARSLGLIGAIVASAAAAVTQRIWIHPMLSTILKAGGKDATFTGRTYIWSRAEVLIEQRPALGLGFSAFWRPGNIEAEAIWKRLFITSKFGFNFHNSRLDILVHLGYVGLALFCIVFAVFGALLVLRTLRQPDPIGIFLVAVLGYEATRMGFESIGYGTFHHATFLLFAALAWGVRPPDGGSAAAHSAPRAQGARPRDPAVKAARG